MADTINTRNILSGKWGFLRKKGTTSRKSQRTEEVAEQEFSSGVPITTASSEIASSATGEAATTRVPEPDTAEEATSPTAGITVAIFTGDGDREAASSTSVDDKVAVKTTIDESVATAISNSRDEVPKSPAVVRSLCVASCNQRDEAAGLWEVAYERLRSRNRPLLDAYERRLRRYPNDGPERRSSLVTVSSGESFARSDPLTRRSQMDQVIDIWQMQDDDIETTSSDREALVDDADRSLRDILRSSLKRSRYAALPWVAACLAAEGLVRPNSGISEASRFDIIEIVSKMEWYIGLSGLLFNRSDENAGELPKSSYNALKDMVMGLYKAILLYMIRQSLMSETESRRPWPFGHDATRQSIFDREVALLTRLKGCTIQTELHQLLDKVQSLRDTSETGSATAEKDKTRLNKVQAKLRPIGPPLFEEKNGKGDVLQLIYNWASATDEYQSLFEQQCHGEIGRRVLWVSGPPGAGKTMLMRATTQRLLEEAEAMSGTEKFNVAYFFCDSRSQPHGYVTQAIKSLIWQMLKSQPSLVRHIEDKFQSTGRKTFNDPNDFYAMSTVFYNMVEDPEFGLTYVLVDGIEEICVDGDKDAAIHPERPDSALRDLLQLITRTSQLPARIKWLVSVDQNKVDVPLMHTDVTTQTTLEINDPRYSQNLQNVSKEYISSKVVELANASGFRATFQSEVIERLSAISPRNFLWVNMACSLIESDGIPWNALSILNDLPQEIPSLYGMMEAKLNNLPKRDQKLCRDILYTAAIAYRSLRNSEMETLVSLQADVDLDILVKKMCSFFLEIHKDSVCYIHPSARDFVRQRLIDTEADSLRHFLMTKRCIAQAIVKDESNSNTYAVTNWMPHLCGVRDWKLFNDTIVAVNNFFDNHLLDWAEILATRGLLPEAVVLLQRLKLFLIKKIPCPIKFNDHKCLKNIQQALWLLNFNQSIESLSTLSPKYSLLFLPSKSDLRQKLLPEALPWLDVAPEMDPRSALDAALHVLQGHDDWVRCCTYSPDGRLVASGGDDGTVRLWDAETVKVQHTFSVPGYVYRVLFTRGQLLMALCQSTIHVWEASTGKPLKSLETESLASLRDIHSSSDGKRFAAAGERAVVTWEIPPRPETDEWVESTLECHNGTVRRVRFSPDGTLLAYSVRSKVYLWHLEQGTMHRCLKGHDDDIDGLAFRPDSRHLASGSDDKKVCVWDVETGDSLCVLKGHGDMVNSVSFSADGSRLASGSYDSTIRIWKLSSGGSDPYRIERVIRGHGGTILMLSFAPEGRYLLSSSTDKTVRIWDIAETPQVAEIVKDEADEPPQPNVEGHSAAINFVEFSHEGEMLASASSDGQICLWNGNTGKFLGSLEEHKLGVMYLGFSGDGGTLVSASMDGTACVWDTNRRVVKYRLRGHQDWVRCAVISPNGKLVASGSDDYSVRVWNTSSLPPVDSGADDGEDTKCRKFSGPNAHSDYVYCVTFSPTGRYLASSGDDREVMIWNLEKGDGDQDVAETVFDVVSGESVRGLAFTLDETRIVSSDCGRVIRIWNLQTKACEQILQHDEQPFRTIQFDKRSPNVLITEFGAWPLDMDSSSPPASKADPDTDDPEPVQWTRGSPPPWCPYGMGKRRDWITWNNKNLILLPTQYRPGEYDRVDCRVQDRKLVIGCDSGQVLFFKFSENASPKL